MLQQSSSGRRIRFRLYALALGALIALLLAEVALRVLGVGPTYAIENLEDFSIALDADRLYRVRPGFSDQVNPQGYRDRDFASADDGEELTLFLGDSFVMGVGVEAEEALPQTLERRLGPGHRVFNMGVFGYGPDQALQALLDDGLRYDPDRVILGVYAGNDFDDLAHNRLFEIRQGASVRTRSNPAAKVLRAPRLFLFARSKLTGHWLPAETEFDFINPMLHDCLHCHLLTLPAEDRATQVELMRGVLREFNRELERRGIPFLAVILPTYQNIQEPELLSAMGVEDADLFHNERTIEAICESEGVEYLSLREPLLAMREEGMLDPAHQHLTPLAARVAADRIAAHLSGTDGDSPVRATKSE